MFKINTMILFTPHKQKKLYAITLGVVLLMAGHPPVAHCMESNTKNGAICHFDKLNQDIICSIFQCLTPKDIKANSWEEVRINKATYSASLLSLRSTKEIMIANKEKGYQCWSGIPHFSPQQLFWINDNVIELLGLSMNLKAGRGSDSDLHKYHSDLDRYHDICKRFLYESSLPKDSIVMQYVKFLAKDHRVFGGLLQGLCLETDLSKNDLDVPDLEHFLTQPDCHNERGLLLFHTYLYGREPNIEGLSQDPLYSQIEGGMGAFIRAQAILHPIRLKRTLEDAMTEQDFYPLITMAEIKHLILLDDGITKKDMVHIFEVIIDYDNETRRVKANKCAERLKPLVMSPEKRKEQEELVTIGLPKLKKIVSKYKWDYTNFSYHTYSLMDGIQNLYKRQAPKELYARFLHSYGLLVPINKTNYEWDHFSKLSNLHREAAEQFKYLNIDDLAVYHNKKIQEIKGKTTEFRPTPYMTSSSNDRYEFKGFGALR